MNKLFEIPFSVDHLSNNGWMPDKEKPSYMKQEEYDKWVEDYKKAEEKVMFKNINVQFESCECGGEYGCSHAPYPFQMNFDDKDIEAMFEDDGFYLQNSNGFMKFDKEKEITMGHFVCACELIGIKLEPTDYFKTLCDGFLLFNKTN